MRSTRSVVRMRCKAPVRRFRRRADISPTARHRSAHPVVRRAPELPLQLRPDLSRFASIGALSIGDD